VNTPRSQPADAAGLKQCCASLYESEAARWLLGDSFHPGGLRLTERLGVHLQLNERSMVLDVAAGTGASALYLAERFGCQVIGVDLSPRNVLEASAAATARHLATRVRFGCADAERLPFPDGPFDAVICECAFCTFPDKGAAAREFARVLRVGGRVGLSDLTRRAPLPESLSGLLAWISCIADALPVEAYQRCLAEAGLATEAPEPHDEALDELVRQVEGRLLATELTLALSRTLPGNFDLRAAKTLAREAREAIARRLLGYCLIVATRSAIEQEHRRP
jgi:SAM-dependent methyltransferase